MSFQVTLDAEAAISRVEAMAQNVIDLHRKVPDELVAWQSEDMKRQFPNITTGGPGTWFTLIWPRSRQSRQRRKRPIAAPAVVRKGVVTSSGGGRPILRAELFDALKARMRGLLDQVMLKPK